MWDDQLVMQTWSEVSYWLYILTMVLMVIPAVYLLNRTVKTRLYYMLYLALSYFLFILTYILSYASFGIPDYIRGIFSYNYPISLIFFVKYAYYKQKKSAFIFVLISTLICKLGHFFSLTLYGFRFPLINSLDPSLMIQYQLYLGISCLLVWIPFGWLTYASGKAFLNSRSKKLELWVKRRNLLQMIAGIIFLFIPIAYYIGPYDGSGYESLAGLISSILSSNLILIAAFILFVCWVSPSWLKKALLYKNEVNVEFPDAIEDKPIVKDAKKILRRKEIMAIIDYLGAELAKYIENSQSSLKGLLMVSIASEFGDDSMYSLNLLQLEQALLGAMKVRLKILGIVDIDKIIDEIVESLIKNQSILMMIQV